MRSIETSAKTIEDAIRQGLEKLDVSLGDVTIDIIQEGSKGLFGFMGGKDAKVRLTVKDREQEDDILAAFSTRDAMEDEPQPAPRQSAPKPETKPHAPKPELKAQAPKQEPKIQAPKPEQKSSTPKPEQTQPKKQKQQPKAETAEKPAKELNTADAPEPLKDYPIVDPETSIGKAQQFIINVTKLMNLDVAVEAGTDEEGNVLVNIHGDTLGILIGRRGETLDALQYLASLNVNHGQEEYTRVTLDTENYRSKREESLRRLATRMANRAVKTGRKVVMEPMNPYERRILHSALQQNEAVTTHSEGDEPNRHVVISLK
jgi:spoIIIJ-associated protein